MAAAIDLRRNLYPGIAPPDIQRTATPVSYTHLTRYDVDPDLAKLKDQVLSVSGVSLRASATNPQILNPRDHRVEIQLLSKGDQLIERLRGKLGVSAVPDEAALRVEWVGPKAGKQLRDSARNAVAYAIVFIMLYLSLIHISRR